MSKYNLDEFSEKELTESPSFLMLKSEKHSKFCHHTPFHTEGKEQTEGICSDSSDNCRRKGKRKDSNGFKQHKQYNPQRQDENVFESMSDQQFKHGEIGSRKTHKQDLNLAIKPNDAIKLVVAFIDEKIMINDCGAQIATALTNMGVEYAVKPQIFADTITWSRRVQPTKSDEEQLSDDVLLIMGYKELINQISKNLLIEYIKIIRTVYINKFALCIYGLEQYFTHQKHQRKNDLYQIIGSDINANGCKIFDGMPQISRREVEYALTELQILFKLEYRLLENCEDMILFITQFTKSLAQVPYKLVKQDKAHKLDWYVSGENKDCVTVNKNGNGLKRLWQQQLTTFPLARLEVAEVISSKYATPTLLLEAYDTCESKEAEELLQDIPIRRTGGPLASVRKIGPELSRKIHKYCTSLNSGVLL